MRLADPAGGLDLPPGYGTCVRVVAMVCIAACSVVADDDLTRWVDTRIGSQTSYELSRGNTYPAVALPSGMTFWSPETGGYESAQFYRYGDSSLSGLRATHQASVWLGDYGQFSLMPTTGDPGFLPEQRGSAFRHETETAHPHLYSVELDNFGLRVEMAPTARAAVMRVTSSGADTVTFIIDPHPPRTTVEDDATAGIVRGVSLTRMGGAPLAYGCHFALVFDRPSHRLRYIHRLHSYTRV
ncbi:MAG: hypothetical protein VCF24_09850 [Candidatus Latescibacterota bacterium]